MDLSKLRQLFNRENAMNVVHWCAVGSGFVIAILATIELPGNSKIAGGAAIALVISQIIHKFAIALEDKKTLTEAIVTTVPLIQAATSGNKTQTNAVHSAVHSSPITLPKQVRDAVKPFEHFDEEKPK